MQDVDEDFKTEGIDTYTKQPLPVAKILPVKENPVASLGNAFKKTYFASDNVQNDMMNRHLEETCVNTEAFVSPEDLKTGVIQYIDEDCANNETCVDVFRGTYGFPMDSWCVGAVTSVSALFHGKNTFNEPIASWKTNQVGFA